MFNKIKPDQKRRPVNIKLFTNGSISLTGCLNDCDGYDAIKVLLEEIKISYCISTKSM